jgi:hypothetical protein
MAMSHDSRSTLAVKARAAGIALVVGLITPGTAVSQPQGNVQRNVTLENLAPRPDDLRTMNIKESDAELRIEITDMAIPDLMSYSVTLPVRQSKTISAWTVSGKGHLSLKVSFRGKMCLDFSPQGSLNSRYKFRLRAISPPACSLEF